MVAPGMTLKARLSLSSRQSSVRGIRWTEKAPGEMGWSLDLCMLARSTER
jgi:hypothetical protein